MIAEQTRLRRVLIPTMFVLPMMFVLATMFVLNVGAQSDWVDTSPHKTGFVTVNSVRLHYLDWGGTGEAILFLHALGDTPHIYDSLAPRFTNQFRVLGLTRRGHGQSEIPESGYDTPTRVEDICQFLDALNIHRAILVGHSTGGGEMTMLAGVHPERVIKLVYLDAVYDSERRLELARQAPPEMSPTQTESESLDGRRRWLKRMNNGWSEAWEATLRENSPSDGKMLLNRERRDKALTLMTAEGTETRQDYSKIKSPALNITVAGFPSNMVNYFKALPEPRRNATEDFLRLVDEIKTEEADRFRKELPTARVVILTNADHHCFIEREEDVLREMRKFLAR